MKTNKEEQLKKALTKTLSTDDIQKKLEEETKNIKKTKKEVKIPFIKDKEHDEEKESNLLLYLVSIIAALLLILTIYLFTSENFNTKTINIETSDTQEPKSNEIKQVIKEELDKVVKELGNEIEKEVILEKGNFKKFYNSLKFNTLKCYDFKTANPKPDESCLKQLKPFLDKNKDAIRFEVIPVMSKDDNKLFEGIKKTLDNKDEKYVQTVKEYLLRGLSRQRVLEVSWKIKEILGEDIVLTPTNYYVKSKDKNKGVLIRAYH